LAVLRNVRNGGISTSRNAESIGLIVTELVINSLKHAFDETTKGGEITVACDVSGTDWQLAVSDNGSGKPDGVFAQPKTGLGTGVVKALARQLDAQVVTSSGALGPKFRLRTPRLQPRDLSDFHSRPILMIGLRSEN
jgi:chemotaxis protein methyltransferase CheR